MDWVHVSDLVAGRSVDPDFIPRILAYVEMRAAYETLDKVLQILYQGEDAGLVDERLVAIVSEWLSETREQYRFYAAQLDPWFREAWEAARKLAEKQQAHPAQQAESKGAESA